MDYQIATFDCPPLRILSIRERHPAVDLPAFIGASFGELFGRLQALGVTPAGPPLALYHEFGPDAIDAEVCVPVAKAVSAKGRIKYRVLPAATVARTVHIGPYEELQGAYGVLTGWIVGHELEMAGPVRERYLNAPDEDTPPSAYRTEIEIPVVPRPVAVPA
jgi:effector-binding domain-containing protein